jgi:preprotein translocase subunit SecF
VSRNQRFVVLGLAAVVLIVAVVVIGTGGSSNSTKDAGPTTIEVKNAQPVGGVKDVTFKKGGTVDLTVKSDTADEVHFHGYDVHKDVAKGGSVHFRFPASIEGKFIVELEDHKQTLANVTVAP